MSKLKKAIMRIMHDARLTNGPGHAKMSLMPYANNKGADQPAHPRSLISTFVVRCLDSMTCTCSIQSYKILVSFCCRAGWFQSYLFENPQRHIFAWCGSNVRTHFIAPVSQSGVNCCRVCKKEVSSMIWKPVFSSVGESGRNGNYTSNQAS